MASGDLNRKEIQKRGDVCIYSPQLFGAMDWFCGIWIFHGLGWGVVSGWFKCITCTVHFISIIITSVPPQIIRPLIPEAGDPCEADSLCCAAETNTAVSGRVSERHSVMSNCLWPHGLYSPWSSPGQNTGVGSLSLLQWIFPTQGLNPGLPHCRQILHPLSHKGSPRILEWVAYPFSSGSSWPWNGTVVSRIAGRFFTNWAMSIVKQLYSNKIF